MVLLDVVAGLTLRRVFPHRSFVVLWQRSDRLVVLHVSSAKVSTYPLATLAVPAVHLLPVRFSTFNIVKLVIHTFVLFGVDLVLVKHLGTAYVLSLLLPVTHMFSGGR